MIRYVKGSLFKDNEREGKKLNFCGECNQFPCEMLSNMGKEYGFDPSVKLEQCRKWLLECNR